MVPARAAVLAAPAAVEAVSSDLARTGRAVPLLAAGIAVGVGLLLRAGRSRLDRRDAEEPAPDDDLV